LTRLLSGGHQQGWHFAISECDRWRQVLATPELYRRTISAGRQVWLLRFYSRRPPLTLSHRRVLK
jgi:hypothetical protein